MSTRGELGLLTLRESKTQFSKSIAAAFLLPVTRKFAEFQGKWNLGGGLKTKDQRRSLRGHRHAFHDFLKNLFGLFGFLERG